MTRNIGLPRKKRVFDLLDNEDEYGYCLLDKSILYVLSYLYNEDGGEVLKLHKVNLDLFDGNLENNLLLFESSKVGCCLFQKGGKYLFLPEEFGLLFNLEDLPEDGLFEKKLKKIESESDIYGSIIFDDFILKQVDADEPKKGMSLIDVVSGGRQHLDIDFCEFQYVYEGLVVGTRDNKNFAIFSLDKNEFVCELDSEKYFNCEPTSELLVSGFDGYLAVAYNDSVVVVSLSTFEVLHHVNLLDDDRICSMIDKYGTERRNLNISSLSFSDKKVILSGGSAISYVICLDVSDQMPNINWVYQGFDDNQIVYSGGDVIFGVQKSRPTAWDVYSGEVIWEGSAGVIATQIQIGDGWLVYSSFAGNIQCFQWKKPYISPHRPAV